MHAKYHRDVERMVKWAEDEARIHALMIIGSQARKQLPNSEWSDLDILMLVEDTDFFVASDDWLQMFGRPVIVAEEVVELGFVDLTWYVKRPLFADFRAIDLNIMPFDRIDDVLSINRDIHAKGYEIIYDAHNDLIALLVEDSLKDVAEPNAPQITETRLEAVVTDLLYHVLWALKKTLVNELWVAVNCVNCYMRKSLLELIEFHNATLSRQTGFISYDGRFLETRTAPSVLDKLENCFTKYQKADLIRTLENILDVVSSLAIDICRACNYDFDVHQYQAVRQMFSDLRETSLDGE